MLLCGVQDSAPEVHVRHRVARGIAPVAADPASAASGSRRCGRYSLSVCSTTRAGLRVSASSAAAAAVSSMRLLVVDRVGCPSIRARWAPKRRIAAQPPGPGLGLQPPSVQISTAGRPASGPSESVGMLVPSRQVEAQPAQILHRVLRASPLRRAAWCSQSYSRVSRKRSAAPWHITGKRRPAPPATSGRTALYSRSSARALVTLNWKSGSKHQAFKAHRDVVGQQVGGGEVEVDQAGQAAQSRKNTLSGNRSAWMCPRGRPCGPGGQDTWSRAAVQLGGEAGLHLVRAAAKAAGRAAAPIPPGPRAFGRSGA